MNYRVMRTGRRELMHAADAVEFRGRPVLVFDLAPADHELGSPKLEERSSAPLQCCVDVWGRREAVDKREAATVPLA
jgi:hypothetical protein